MTSRASATRVPLGFTLWSVLWGIAAFVLTFPWQPNRWSVHRVFPDGSADTQSISIHHLVLWKILRYAVCALATSAPFVARRRPWPACLMAVSCLIPYVIEGHGFNVSLGCFCALLGVAMSSMHLHRRLAWAIGAAALTLPASLSLFSSVTFWTIGVYGQIDSSSWTASQRLETFAIYALGTMFTLGLAASMSISDARARERHDVEVRSAEVDARAYLARDLHDVVAHRMSLVAVRAETAPYSLGDLSPQTREAFADIAAEARGALDEMRTVLGVLDRSHTQDAPDADAANRGGSTPLLTPQPDASTIVSLIDDARAAGSPVDVVGGVPNLDPIVGNTAYRVVQEALTNARRHAPNERATVTFSQDADTARIRVSNPCRPEPFEVGRGLAGMRERVERSGGMFHVKHETDAAGTAQFVVEATLPTRGTSPR